MSNILDYEPKLLWKYFNEMTKIPRESKKEEKISQWAVDVAKKHNLNYKQDSVGNVVIEVPATPGMENLPTVVLQGHLDMVCEKNSDVDHDFDKDPLKLRLEGDWLYATGTTLGADNGVGVAAGLALIEDKEAEHGPLELFFTIDEETGMTGAFEVKSDFLKGKTLINLDTEEEGAYYVGCAGGADSILLFPIDSVAPESGHTALECALSGLLGGHSGLDINTGRANAIKLLNTALKEIFDDIPFQIADYNGGSKRNAIPRESFATVLVPGDKVDDFTKKLKNYTNRFKKEYQIEKDLVFEVKNTSSSPSKALSKDTTKKALALLDELPNGVHAMSKDIKGLVETSNNIGVLTKKDDHLEIVISNRSSVQQSLDDLRAKIKNLAEGYGCKVEEPRGYPGWKPNLESKILKTSKDVFKSLYGKEPEVKAIHAGLECGILGEKFHGLDTISIGPQIENPHSPGERVNIKSVAEFYNLLKNILKNVN